MADVVIQKINSVFIKVECEAGIKNQMSENFTFYADNYQFHPKYKNKMWDGKIRLLNKMTGAIYAGLLQEILEFCVENGYEYIVDEELNYEKNVPSDAAHKLAEHFRAPEYIQPRYYQNDAVVTAIRDGRGFFISPTGSGKSFIIYLTARYHAAKGRSVLVVLPSVGLVKQLAGDFEDYAPGQDLDIQMIAEGADKEPNSNLIFATWQSIYKEKQEYFEQFDVVIGDEADEFDAKSLKGLMEKCVNADYRYGYTGTLEDCTVDRLMLTGMFGPITQVATTKQLQEEGYLADLTINALIFDHAPETRAQARTKTIKGKKVKFTYANEISLLEGLESRNKYIVNLANALEGNTLILFNHVEKHGNILEPMLKETEKDFFYVHGKVKADERNEVRAKVDESYSAVILGSYGTFSRGTNIKRIDNIIFAVSFKSKKRVLQSIGRGLRMGIDSEHCNLYDLVDDLSRNGNENYTLSHFKERVSMYSKEGFKIKYYKIGLKP